MKNPELISILDRTAHSSFPKVKTKGVHEDLLYSPGHSTPYSEITYMGKESEKEWICAYVYLSYSAVPPKLTQHYKPTICQNYTKIV